jgi:hypothetical protein
MPAVLDILIIVPERRWRMEGTRRRVRVTGAKKLVSSWDRHSRSLGGGCYL